MSRFDRIEQDEIRRLIKKHAPAAGGGGVTDHGALTGLADDDHTQYHNDTRGDARYPLIAHTHVKADVTDFAHTHVKADVTDFAHTHSGIDIVSGTVDIARLPTGTTASTVAIGNHTHTLTGEVTTIGLAATLTNSAVIGKVITGYVSGAGTVAATDTILQAIQKLNGNAGGGVTDHGLLTGLADDDHTQYHNDTRGDARYSLLAHTHTLDGLSDVVITTPVSTQILSYNGTNWVNAASTSGATNLDGLSDVVITSPVSTQILAYNGTNWVNTPSTYYQVLTALTTLASVTTAQSIFPSASDVFTIGAASAWLVEGAVFVESGIVSHTTVIRLSWNGLGAANQGTSEFITFAGATGSVARNQDTTWFSTPNGGVIDAASTGAFRTIKFSAQFTALDAGDITPTITFSAAPGGTNLIRRGSWIRFTRLGADTYTHNGGWA